MAFHVGVFGAAMAGYQDLAEEWKGEAVRGKRVPREEV